MRARRTSLFISKVFRRSGAGKVFGASTMRPQGSSSGTPTTRAFVQLPASSVVLLQRVSWPNSVSHDASDKRNSSLPSANVALNWARIPARSTEFAASITNLLAPAFMVPEGTVTGIRCGEFCPSATSTPLINRANRSSAATTPETETSARSAGKFHCRRNVR